MTRRSLLAGAIGVPLATALPAGSRPNVVLIVADDLGWKDVGYHGSEIRTPNIDGIARQGVQFTHLYAYPFCSPTRAGIMTGRSPARYGLIYSVIRPWSHYGLPKDERTMAETFHSLGYQTAMAGKWHLGHTHRDMLPHRRGFDEFYGFVNADVDYYEHTHAGGLDWQRNGKSLREEGYSTDLLGREAERMINGRDKTKPMFLYVAFGAVHTPLQAPPELLEKYAHIANKNRRTHAAMTESMDTAIGRILKSLAAAGMEENTLVAFVSDNGGAPGAGASNQPLRAGKGTVFEGGIRVPALMRWPGKLPAGGEVRQVATVLDLLPTLTAAVGAQPASGKPLDGMNLWPRITGGGTDPRSNLYFAVKRNDTPDYQFALRDGPWKLIRQIHGEAVSAPEMLFNVEADPNEQTDRAAQEPDLVRRLGAKLDEWRALHPKCEIQSSMTPHPGWRAPKDYAQAAADYEF